MRSAQPLFADGKATTALHRDRLSRRMEAARRYDLRGLRAAAAVGWAEPETADGRHRSGSARGNRRIATAGHLRGTPGPGLVFTIADEYGAAEAELHVSHGRISIESSSTELRASKFPAMDHARRGSARRHRLRGAAVTATTVQHRTSGLDASPPRFCRGIDMPRDGRTARHGPATSSRRRFTASCRCSTSQSAMPSRKGTPVLPDGSDEARPYPESPGGRAASNQIQLQRGETPSRRVPS